MRCSARETRGPQRCDSLSARARSLPTRATEVSVQPAKIRSMPTSRPIAQSAELGNLARTRMPISRPATPLRPTRPAFGWPRAEEGDGDPGHAHEEEVDAEHAGSGSGCRCAVRRSARGRRARSAAPRAGAGRRCRPSGRVKAPATRKAPATIRIQPMKIAVPTEATAGTTIATQPSDDRQRRRRSSAPSSCAPALRAPPGPSTLRPSPCADPKRARRMPSTRSWPLGSDCAIRGGVIG